MRLFVGVVPPVRVLDAVDALPRPETPGVRWTTRDQWHVTLRFLGEVDDPEPVAAALRRAPFPHRPTVFVGPTVANLGPGVVCLPVRGLDAHAALAVAATRDMGTPPEDRPFRGHLTLARTKDGGARRFAGTPFEETWECDEAVLVQSTLHPQGARYDVIARFPL